ADSGIEELQKNVDTLIVIPNQNLFLVAKAETTFKEAFQLADEVLQQGVRSITDLMVMPGLINLDFADVRSVMGEMGKAMMGTGEGQGDNRALEAAERAIANPLLDGVSMQGAKGVIISIIGGEDMKLLEVDEAANHIRELVDPEANIIWGSAFNPDLEGKIRVSVVATGIEQGAEQAQAAATQFGGFGAVRAPKKPALPLPTEEELAGDAVASAPGQPARFEEEENSYGTAEAAEDAYAAPTSPEPYGDDEEDEYDEEGLAEPADDSHYGDESEAGYASLGSMRIERDPNAVPEETGEEAGGEPEAGEDDAFELTLEAPQPEEGPPPAEQDELLLDASRLAEADEPVQAAVGGRRRRMLGGAAEGEEAEEAAPAPAPRSAPGAGSTLFERMANLSRASATSDDEDDEEEGGGSSLRIPRFLGRQNNQ